MIIQSIVIRQFRAHTDTALTFTPGLNLIYGPNGVGKTNVLEALHYLCLTKSFLASSDTYALRKGAPFFELKGQFAGTRRSTLTARLAYVPNDGKQAFLNGAPLQRFSELVGILPVVVFSPDDQRLTADGPSERRRFVDNVMSQAYPRYLDDLLKYRRALRQRNELLAHHKRSRTPPPAALLDSWDTEVVTLGSQIIAARRRFLNTFATHLQAAIQHVQAVTERPTLAYQSIAPLDDADTTSDVEAKYRQVLDRNARRERQRGVTVVGPHRDEVVFRLDDLPVRRYASQGQHRTLGLALKLAQYSFLREALDETPILLLDDVFDHLDAARTRAFLDLLQSPEVGQCVLTATGLDRLAGFVDWSAAAHQAIQLLPGPRAVYSE